MAHQTVIDCCSIVNNGDGIASVPSFLSAGHTPVICRALGDVSETNLPEQRSAYPYTLPLQPLAFVLGRLGVRCKVRSVTPASE